MANGASETDKFTTDGPGDGKQTSEPEEMDQEISVNEEYGALEETLDQLDSCLDDLEGKNDSLNAKLRSLLESTKEASAEMTGDKECQGDSGKDNSDIPKDLESAH